MPHETPPDRKPCRVWPIAVIAATLLPAVVLPAVASQQGYFTDSQAQAGKQTYTNHCAMCHGSKLQGQAGPALAGRKFASSLKFGKMSTPQLFDFIAKHMPKNNPGSLSQQQDIDVLAYLLAQNGFPSGNDPLDKSKLGQIDLLPLPDAGAAAHSGSQ